MEIAKAKPKALIVDDDPTFCAILMAVLRGLEVDARSFENAPDFLKELKKSKADICFVDLNIGDLGVGFKVIEAIRSVLGNKLPLIVISGASDDQAVTHAMEIGATDFITKPVDRKVLLSKVSRYISTKKIEKEKPALFSVPNAGVDASVAVNVYIESIDEFGMNFLSDHLLVKGRVIAFDGEEIERLTGSSSINLRVISTKVDRTENLFGGYAEFNHSDETLMSSVRKYLANRISKTQGTEEADGAED